MIWLLLGALLSASALRQPIQGVAGWRLAGPEGGWVNGVASDPTNASVAYAGTPNGLYATADAGATWTKRGLDGQAIGAPAVDSVTPSILWCTTTELFFFNHDVYDFLELRRSEDFGVTWTAVGSTALGVGFAFALDPSRSGTAYFAGQSNEVHLLKTTDGGASWTPLPLTLVGSVAVDPAIPSRIYAAARTTLEDPSTTLFVSTDSGATWRSTLFQKPELLFLVADGSRPGVVYAAGTRLWVSRNAGSSWFDRTPFSTSDRVGGLAADPAIAGRVYLAAASGLVYVSDDWGESWSPGAPLPTASWLTGRTSGGVWASGRNGIFAADPPVAEWTPMDHGILSAKVGALAVAPSNPSIVYAVASGLARSRDGGATWSANRFAPTDSLKHPAVAVDPDSPETVYFAAASGALARSPDGGASWTTLLAPAKPICSIAIDPGQSSVLYVVEKSDNGNDGVLWKSMDRGDTWRSIEDLGTGVAFVEAGAGAIWASNGYLYRSLDGAAWTRLSLPQTDSVDAVAFDPADEEIVYASTGEAIYKSIDGGDHWAPVASIPADGIVRSQYVATNLAGDLVAYGIYDNFGLETGGAPWMSRDQGATWSTSPSWTFGSVTSLHSGSALRVLVGTEMGVVEMGTRTTSTLSER